MQAAHRQSCISCSDHLVYYARTILVVFQVDQQARSVLDRSAKGNWHSMHWIAAQLLTFAPLHVGLFLMKRPGGVLRASARAFATAGLARGNTAPVMRQDAIHANGAFI